MTRIDSPTTRPSQAAIAALHCGDRHADGRGHRRIDREQQQPRTAHRGGGQRDERRARRTARHRRGVAPMMLDETRWLISSSPCGLWASTMIAPLAEARKTQPVAASCAAGPVPVAGREQRRGNGEGDADEATARRARGRPLRRCRRRASRRRTSTRDAERRGLRDGGADEASGYAPPRSRRPPPAARRSASRRGRRGGRAARRRRTRRSLPPRGVVAPAFAGHSRRRAGLDTRRPEQRRHACA